MAEPKYPNHPYKGEIDKRIDNGDSACSIHKWLLSYNDPNITLSLPTLTKIRKRRQMSSPSLAPKTAIKVGSMRELDRKVSKLWDVVKLCDKLEQKMSDKINIVSIKDWQYVNQQKQEALKLIANIQGEKSSEGDISVVLAKIFAKIETKDTIPDDTVIDAVISELKEPGKVEPKPIQDKVPGGPV